MNIRFLILPITCGVMLLPYSSGFGAVRVGNNSAARYGFVNTPRVNNTATTVNQTTQTVNQPIVDNGLETCQNIYPTGEFEIAGPTIGNQVGHGKQCVAVVELRGYQMGPNGTNLVFARSKLAAGDNFKCNIDSFPEADMNIVAVESVAFPGDKEPTVDDVKVVMDQEQRQNAGLKIAAAALAGGLGGNLLGKNDVGNDSMFGADKGKLIATGAGAAGAAALMAASTYSGKVAGDMILSTGVNATAGAVVGNIAARNSGDSVLLIEDSCKVLDGVDAEKQEEANGCLWGKIDTGKTYVFGDGKKLAYWSPQTNKVLECDEPGGGETGVVAKGCHYISLNKIVIENEKSEWVDQSRKDKTSTIHTSDMVQSEKDKLIKLCKNYQLPDNNTELVGSQSGGEVYCKIKSAYEIGKSIPVLLTGVVDKLTGYTMSDWKENKNNWFARGKLYKRDSNGNGVYDGDIKENTSELYSLENFTPLTLDSDDGGIVDFSNKARLKGTAIGGATGGALGGFVAYKGATDAIQERWVSEVRQYKDSLQKFYCQTGDRFLGYYNDVVAIPELPDITE